MAIFQIKNSDIFHISAQSIDCGYQLEPPCRGGANEYPQSIFTATLQQGKVPDDLKTAEVMPIFKEATAAHNLTTGRFR